jgi:hypothetical protein
LLVALNQLLQGEVHNYLNAPKQVQNRVQMPHNNFLDVTVNTLYRPEPLLLV